MGAAIFLLAIAARRRQEEDQRRHREMQRRREEERRRRKSSKSSFGHTGPLFSYDSGNHYSFQEHIRKIVSENPTYSKYIQALYDEGSALDDEKRSELESQFEELVPGLKEQEEVIKRLREQIEATGITISDKDKLGSMRIDQVDTRYLYAFKIGTHTYSYGGHPITFNGIRIDEEILAQEGKIYKDEYDRAVEENPDVDIMVNRERKMLSRQESIKRLPLMDTYSRDVRIRGLRDDIRHHEGIQREIAEKKEKKDTFEALTPEQKDLIKQYLAAIQKFRELMEPATKIIDVYRQIDSMYRPDQDVKTKWETAAKRAIESGKVTPEDERLFYEMMKQEMASMQTSYQDGIPLIGADIGKEFGNEGPLTWIIKVGAIEYARAEKERLKTEEKSLDEAMALAQKRDTLVQEGQTPTVEEEERKGKKEDKEEAEQGDSDQLQ